MGNKLYVGNIAYDTTEEELRDAFAQDGRQVERVAIITDQTTGRPRGFAFVTMVTDADAQNAIQALNGQSLGGRTLTVNEARERERRGGGGGGGDRDRGGDRGGGGRGDRGGDREDRGYGSRGGRGGRF
jgi:cold-inducible RNA-binding protein